MSALKEKVLLLLLAGVAFGFSYTPHGQWKILKELDWRWRKINEKELRKEIASLYQSKCIERKENPDGSYTLVLTKKGKLKALTFHFQEMKIKHQDWDGHWRLVIFDIPEKFRRGRDALREKLKDLGFYELQKSALVFPFRCEDEINFLIEFFELRKYVRLGLLRSLDNELHLKKIFKLI